MPISAFNTNLFPARCSYAARALFVRCSYERELTRELRGAPVWDIWHFPIKLGTEKNPSAGTQENHLSPKDPITADYSSSSLPPPSSPSGFPSSGFPSSGFPSSGLPSEELIILIVAFSGQNLLLQNAKAPKTTTTMTIAIIEPPPPFLERLFLEPFLGHFVALLDDSDVELFEHSDFELFELFPLFPLFELFELFPLFELFELDELDELDFFNLLKN